MSRSQDHKASGPAGVIVFAVMCVLLLAFAIWQPSTDLWIAEPASSDAPATTAAIAATPPAPPMRRPIEPAAWAQVVDQGKANR